MVDPLPISTFFDAFEVEDVQFIQSFNQQRTMTGGADTKYADRAPSLWKAQVTSAPMENADAEGFMALINSRAGGIKTSLLFNKRLPYPRNDPDGSIIGMAAPEISVITDRLNISFSDFPVGYVLARGTYFGCIFDTSRYYLGQVLADRTADGSGDVASVEIWPPLPASIVTTTVISVSKPSAKFKIVPGSAYPSKVTGTLSTIQFAAEQTYSA